MAELYSQYTSGQQFTAGTIAGSFNGVSGLNPIVDRVNSIATSDNLVTGSVISGTATNIITAYQNGNQWTGSVVSGTNMTIYASGLVQSLDRCMIYASGGTQTTSGAPTTAIALSGVYFDTNGLAQNDRIVIKKDGYYEIIGAVFLLSGTATSYWANLTGSSSTGVVAFAGMYNPIDPYHVKYAVSNFSTIRYLPSGAFVTLRCSTGSTLQYAPINNTSTNLTVIQLSNGSP